MVSTSTGIEFSDRQINSGESGEQIRSKMSGTHVALECCMRWSLPCVWRSASECDGTRVFRLYVRLREYGVYNTSR